MPVKGRRRGHFRFRPDWPDCSWLRTSRAYSRCPGRPHSFWTAQSTPTCTNERRTFGKMPNVRSRLRAYVIWRKWQFMLYDENGNFPLVFFVRMFQRMYVRRLRTNLAFVWPHSIARVMSYVQCGVMKYFINIMCQLLKLISTVSVTWTIPNQDLPCNNVFHCQSQVTKTCWLPLECSKNWCLYHYRVFQKGFS